jgi:hypothetical protein
VKHRKTFWQIFAVPTLIGVLSVVGLVAALVGDGWWDGVSWLTLTIPVLLYFFYVLRRRRASSG